jgi:hypothetical protein
VSSTISTRSSKPSVSKPRDFPNKREQNSRHGHYNGLTSSTSGLAEFCNSVSDIISNIIPTGQKDVWSTLATIVDFKKFVKPLSDAVAALYNNHRSDKALTRRSIQTQLEAARWPDFAEVEPNQ